MKIGIDLGGTKTEIICLHDTNGKELYRQRVPSPTGSYKKTIQNIVDMIESAEKTLNQKGTIGIGIPGIISKVTGKVKNSNSTWLNNHPLDKDLEKSLKRKIRVENDANCFALSEACDGAGSDYNSVFGVIIGTGCGAGLVHKKEIISGANGIGGEWGHNPLPFPKIYMHDKNYKNNFIEKNDEQKINEIYIGKNPIHYFTDKIDENEYPGVQCYCGKRGCLETWISGTGFKADYNRVYNSNLSTHDIIKEFQKTEEKAVTAFNKYVDRLARGLATIINIYDPDVIILGGGMGNVRELYDLVPKAWDKYIFSNTYVTKLKPPVHGDSSGVRGAAWLWS